MQIDFISRAMPLTFSWSSPCTLLSSFLPLTEQRVSNWKPETGCLHFVIKSKPSSPPEPQRAKMRSDLCADKESFCKLWKHYFPTRYSFFFLFYGSSGPFFNSGLIGSGVRERERGMWQRTTDWPDPNPDRLC